MFDEPPERSSPSNALVALGPVDPEWQPILHVSNQVVLYHPTSHALTIRTHSRPSSPSHSLARNTRCPYCHRSFSPHDGRGRRHDLETLENDFQDNDFERAYNRAANYFQLLEIANEQSRPASPIRSNGLSSSSSTASVGPSAFRADNMAEGYFKAFFQEVCKLGMGANGSVFLCQHVLDGNQLGYFAVKKVAVGQSHSYLLNTLREVRLLEKLHHPNVVTYHHAWLEPYQFSSFGPRVPTLHILMQWAEGGSLDDLIDTRLGRRTPHLPHLHTTTGAPESGISVPPSPTATPDAESSADHPYSRNARIRAFRALQRAPPEERERIRWEMGLNGNGNGIAAQSAKKAPIDLKAVHLLSAEEIHDIFKDVVSGLAFLHEKSILHLDLKPGNVLLTWDEGRLVPRAMLSDFGTSQDMLNSRTRSGNTGTLEYSAPESLPVPTTGELLQVNSKADMWSLGMILHKLLFFRLPFRHTSDNDDPSRPKDGTEYSERLEAEILAYPGFKSTPTLSSLFESRRLPMAYLLLLETLLNTRAAARPSSERVLGVMKEGGLNPIARVSRTSGQNSTLALARPSHVRVSGEPRSISPALEILNDATFEEVKDVVGSPLITAENRLFGFSIPRRWSHIIEGWQRRAPAYFPRAFWTRAAKSSILAVKVFTLSQMCPDSRPQSVVSGFALALAILDTCLDGVRATLAFGAAHAVLLAMMCARGRCCQ